MLESKNGGWRTLVEVGTICRRLGAATGPAGAIILCIRRQRRCRMSSRRAHTKRKSWPRKQPTREFWAIWADHCYPGRQRRRAASSRGRPPQARRHPPRGPAGRPAAGGVNGRQAGVFQAAPEAGHRGPAVCERSPPLLKEHYGIRAEKLAEFNLQPFRGRIVTASAKKPGLAEEPISVPPVPTDSNL